MVVKVVKAVKAVKAAWRWRLRIIKKTGKRSRLRDRRIREQQLADAVIETAVQTGEWAFGVSHGGGAPRPLGTSPTPSTEVAVVVAHPTMGLAVVWRNRALAPGITERRAAEACLPVSGDLWDGRRIKEDLREASRATLKAAFAGEIGAVEALAMLNGDKSSQDFSSQPVI